MGRKFSLSINAVRRQLVLDYIREHYSLSQLLIDLGVWDGGTTVITCPFHPDSRPSFNIDVDNNFYKCFSCGSYGGYMSFYHNYHKIVTEDEKFFNDHVEDVLQNDMKMQEVLGFSTIFVKIENKVSLEELASFRYRPADLLRVDTKSLRRIQRKLQKDPEKLIDFFAEVERGISLDELWNKYYLGIKVDDILLDSDSKLEIMSEFDKLLLSEDSDDFMEETSLF